MRERKDEAPMRARGGTETVVVKKRELRKKQLSFGGRWGGCQL